MSGASRTQVSLAQHKPRGDSRCGRLCWRPRGQEETGGGSQTMGDGRDHPWSLHSYPRQGLMEKPNQVTGQRAQEEVRGQGSEVVHFIDQVLPTSCNTLQSQTLSFATMPPTD